MFGTRLKEIRKKRGYTQVSLAEALGVSKGTVAMWETKKELQDLTHYVRFQACWMSGQITCLVNLMMTLL